MFARSTQTRPLLSFGGTVSRVCDVALGALDGTRRSVLRRLVRLPGAPTLLARREPRLAVVALAHAAAALAGAIWLPVWMLVVGPLAVGVPHLAADLRHLLLRRAWLPAERVLLVAVAAGLALAQLGPGDDGGRTRGSLMVLGAGSVLAVALAASRRSRRTRPLAGDTAYERVAVAGVVLAGLACLLVVGWRHALAFRVVLVHVHNLLAFVLAALFVPRRRRSWWLMAPLVFIVGAAALLARGTWASMSLHAPGAALFRTHVLLLADGLAPGCSPRLALGLTTSFAFLQTCHYLVWLVVIPELDRARSGATTVRTRVASWWQDLGPWGVLAVVGASLVLAAVAARTSIPEATHVYLTWASFHAYLELFVLVAWLLARGRPVFAPPHHHIVAAIDTRSGSEATAHS